MPPQFTKDEWYTEVDETEGTDLPEAPILTVTVHDEDETNKFQYKVSSWYSEWGSYFPKSDQSIFIELEISEFLHTWPLSIHGCHYEVCM